MWSPCQKITSCFGWPCFWVKIVHIMQTAFLFLVWSLRSSVQYNNRINGNRCKSMFATHVRWGICTFRCNCTHKMGTVKVFTQLHSKIQENIKTLIQIIHKPILFLNIFFVGFVTAGVYKFRINLKHQEKKNLDVKQQPGDPFDWNSHWRSNVFVNNPAFTLKINSESIKHPNTY